MDRIADIFRLAGLEPAKPGDADVAVRRVELRMNRKLPPAFRAFLLLDPEMDLLRQYSNDDDPIPCARLGKRPKFWGDYDPLSDHLLPFMNENQGVCTWAIELGDDDDPRVFVEVDSGSPPKWQFMAAAFTDWLACQVEDRFPSGGSALFLAQAPELTDEGLQLLRSRFQEGYTTFAWPGRTNYRFSNARSQLVLWSNEGQCDWCINVMPGVHADDALDELRGIAGLTDSLYANRDEDTRALQSWKNRHGKA